MTDLDPDLIHQFFMAILIGDLLLFCLLMMAIVYAFVAFIRQFFNH